MNQKKPVVLLLWYMQGDNFGDVLIYKTVSTYLEENGFLVESHEVGDKIEKIFEHANKCDFLLFAGGGIIERYIPEIIREFMSQAQVLQVPYGVIGLSVGEFDYKKFSQELAYWVNHAKFFYVRDSESKIKLEEFSGEGTVLCGADCVFVSKIIAREKEVQGIHRGINIRELPYKDITGDFDWKEINSVLEEVGCNYEILDSDSNRDLIFMQNDDKEEYQQFMNLKRDEKVEYIIDSIRKCEWIIAMRFHVVLVAAAMGIIAIPIAYCPKVARLASQLGLEDLTIEIDEINKIPQKIQILGKNHAHYVNTMKKNIVVMRERADAMFSEVLQILNEELKG